MNSPRNLALALLNLGGGEIVLILALLLILAVVVVGFAGLVYLIVRAIVNRPSSVASLPPAMNTQELQQRDRDQVKLLAIFHFVFAGLGFLGIGFLGLHYLIMHTVFSNPEMWKQQQHPPPFSPQEFLNVFVWFYLFGGVLLLAGIVLNALSGLFLLRKRNRTFSIIVAGLDCLQIPFGTALGIFTIIVLSRRTVSQVYEGQTGPEGGKAVT